VKPLLKGLSAVLAFAALAGLFPGCRKNADPSWRPGEPLAKEKIRIGVIYPNRITPESGYDYMHYLGIVAMREAAGLGADQIIRKEGIFEDRPGEVETAIRECIAEGANIIIATSWGYMDICEKLAAEFPQVLFAHATGTKSNALNFTNYFGRLYQARYLSGIVAGLRTGTGKIGFVAAMGTDSSEVTSGVNAFALGVESVNPAARIHVKVTYSWFDPMGETDAARLLIARGCDVIAMHCNTAHPLVAAEKAGVWGIGYNSDMSAAAPGAVLTSVVWDWGVYYTHLVRSVIDGTFTTTPYLGGIGEGMVGLSPLAENLVAPGTAPAVEAGRRRIVEEGFNVFDGVLETNDGRTLGKEGTTLSDREITGGIHWYYRTVIEEN
jgi:basic membrane protein A